MADGDERLLDWAIRDRFNAERHPQISVDGEDWWDIDRVEEEDD